MILLDQEDWTGLPTVVPFQPDPFCDSVILCCLISGTGERYLQRSIPTAATLPSQSVCRGGEPIFHCARSSRHSSLRPDKRHVQVAQIQHSKWREAPSHFLATWSIHRETGAGHRTGPASRLFASEGSCLWTSTPENLYQCLW